MLDYFFACLKDPFRTYAILRYKERKTMEEIAEELNYSTRNVFFLRQKTISMFAFFIKAVVEA